MKVPRYLSIFVFLCSLWLIPCQCFAPYIHLLPSGYISVQNDLFEKSILLALPVWAAHFIAVKPSLRFSGNREQRGNEGGRREVRGGRDDGSGSTGELAVVPLEFYFTEQIIWLTAVMRPPLPLFLTPPPTHLLSHSALCFSSRLRRRVCQGVSGCFPHVLLVKSKGTSNDNSPQLPDHWVLWVHMRQICGPTTTASSKWSLRVAVCPTLQSVRILWNFKVIPS